MTNFINSLKASYRAVAVSGLVAAAFVVAGIPAVTHADTLNRNLSMGMSGADVSALQTFLSQSNTIYPQGLVTGYYGFLTKAAVSNFQSRNEIDPVGSIGPVTLPILNLQILNGMNNASGARLAVNSNGAGNVFIPNLPNTGGIAPVISGVSVGVGRTTTFVSWNTDQAAKGVVYYNTVPLVLSTSLTDVGVSGGYSAMTDTAFRNYQSVTLPNLQPNTLYYYMIYTTDQGGNVSVSWPSTFQTSL